jgi:hypothetical protein
MKLGKSSLLLRHLFLSVFLLHQRDTPTKKHIPRRSRLLAICTPGYFFPELNLITQSTTLTLPNLLDLKQLRMSQSCPHQV